MIERANNRVLVRLSLRVNEISSNILAQMRRN